MNDAIEKTPTVIDEAWTDPIYNDPYIDVDEERSEPVPHRYVHGGFKGTTAEFSFYFPPKEQYQGRFFHNTYPMAITSDIGPFPIQFDVAQGDLGFTLDSGAAYVQTNLGGADRMNRPDPTIGGYRVNAAAAKFFRKVAADIFGDHRPYGYIFGGSGGSFQVMSTAESTRGIWDGFLPFVVATPYCIPSSQAVRINALRILREGGKWAGVMDAINPGGSGDPYAQLNEEEAAALREASLHGYPLRGWWDHETLTAGYFVNNMAHLKHLDPSYVDDFWSKPGYLGTDPTASVQAARIQFDTEIVRVIDGPKQFFGSGKKVEFAAVPDKDYRDADMIVLTGAAAGQSLPLAGEAHNPSGFATTAPAAIVDLLQPGDKVRIDNSWVLAFQSAHRHQVPEEPGYYAWDHLRDTQGKPLYPQRAMKYGPASAVRAGGSVPNGSVTGKTLVLETLVDIDSLPVHADWYRNAVREKLGDAFDDNFAIWMIDHAQHENPLTMAGHAHTVNFSGALQQGLRDLAAWVETGRKPAQTSYAVVDTQVVVPATAAERGGVQAVVDLAVDGAIRADVKVGETVTLTATMEVPAGQGEIVSVEWDFEGVGDYPVRADIKPAAKLTVTATHAYDRPGTYFPVVRIASQREGNARTPYARINNIARARVVVS